MHAILNLVTGNYRSCKAGTCCGKILITVFSGLKSDPNCSLGKKLQNDKIQIEALKFPAFPGTLRPA